jgi:hypothetical protein
MNMKELAARNISAGLREVTNARVAAQAAPSGEIPEQVLHKLYEAEHALTVAADFLRHT